MKQIRKFLESDTAKRGACQFSAEQQPTYRHSTSSQIFLLSPYKGIRTEEPHLKHQTNSCVHLLFSLFFASGLSRADSKTVNIFSIIEQDALGSNASVGGLVRILLGTTTIITYVFRDFPSVPPVP
jgi:hypothetical protein